MKPRSLRKNDGGCGDLPNRKSLSHRQSLDDDELPGTKEKQKNTTTTKEKKKKRKKKKDEQTNSKNNHSESRLLRLKSTEDKPF